MTDKSPEDTVGVLIASALRTRGWTQKKLAERLNVSPQYVNDIVHDRRIPPRWMANAIADGLGVDRDYFSILCGHLPMSMDGIREPEWNLLRLVLAEFRRGDDDKSTE